MDHLAAIRRESARFYDLAGDADPASPVPSCPAWTIADLVWHLGEVHWFWATDVELAATSPDEIEPTRPARPEDYGELVAWGRGQADRLVDELTRAPDDRRVWTWALDDADQTVGFIRRHQVQEAAVHRWDLERAATGSPGAIAGDAAADAIDEVLAITLPWGVNPDKPLRGTVHLHCTDVAGEWVVHGDGRVEAVHAKGDAALRGTASDLLLALYTRIPLDTLEILGDPAVARELVERLNTE